MQVASFLNEKLYKSLIIIAMYVWLNIYAYEVTSDNEKERGREGGKPSISTAALR